MRKSLVNIRTVKESRIKLVSHPPHGLNEGRIGRVGFDLLTQSADMNRHSTGVAIKAVAPHLIEQLVPVKHLAGMAGEEPKQIKFLRSQHYHLTIHRDLAGARVNMQSIKCQRAFGGLAGV